MALCKDSSELLDCIGSRTFMTGIHTYIHLARSLAELKMLPCDFWQGKWVFLFHFVQTGSGPLLFSFEMGTGDYLPGISSTMKLTTHLN